jgi:hypothetical protein
MLMILVLQWNARLNRLFLSYRSVILKTIWTLDIGPILPPSSTNLPFDFALPPSISVLPVVGIFLEQLYKDCVRVPHFTVSSISVV